MSRQMDRDWIEQEYNKWAKEKICDPCGQASRCEYIATLFAEHIIKRVSQITGKVKE